MTEVDGAWSRPELERFLDEALVPIRVGCYTPRDRLWMLSLWYAFEDGAFLCASGRDSKIVRFLEHDDDVCFEVSTNLPPYMGVRGNGTASLAPDDEKAVLGRLLDRYLGGSESKLARSLLADDREEVVITIEPDQLFTWDFTARMADDVVNSPAATRGEPTSPKNG